MNLFGFIEQICEPHEQVVEFEELVCGDLIEFQEGARVGESAVVVEKEQDGAVVLTEDKTRIWIGSAPPNSRLEKPLMNWMNG